MRIGKVSPGNALKPWTLTETGMSSVSNSVGQFFHEYFGQLLLKVWESELFLQELKASLAQTLAFILVETQIY